MLTFPNFNGTSFCSLFLSTNLGSTTTDFSSFPFGILSLGLILVGLTSWPSLSSSSLLVCLDSLITSAFSFFLL